MRTVAAGEELTSIAASGRLKRFTLILTLHRWSCLRSTELLTTRRSTSRLLEKKRYATESAKPENGLPNALTVNSLLVMKAKLTANCCTQRGDYVRSLRHTRHKTRASAKNFFRRSATLISTRCVNAGSSPTNKNT